MKRLDLKSLDTVSSLIIDGTIKSGEISRFQKDGSTVYSYKDEDGNVYNSYILAKNDPALKYFLKVKEECQKGIRLMASMVDTMEGILDTDKYSSIRNYILKLMKKYKCDISLSELCKRPIIFIKIDWKLIRENKSEYCDELSKVGDFSELMDLKKFTIFEYHSIIRNIFIETSYSTLAPTFEYLSDIVKQVIDDPIKQKKEIQEIVDYIVAKDQEEKLRQKLNKAA